MSVARLVSNAAIRHVTMMQPDTPTKVDGSTLYASQTSQGKPCWVKEDSSGNVQTIVSAQAGVCALQHFV
jgi:phosphoribosyl-AMP cyclohydrolase